MKKLFAILALFGAMMTSNVAAQEENQDQQVENVATDNNESADAADNKETANTTAANNTEEKKEESLHYVLKQKFIEGGVPYMGACFLCLILGLALSIERILYLSLSSVNTNNLLKQIEGKLDQDDVKGAKDICANTRGPVASIFYQGLSRMDDGVEMVEKTVTSYGSVQLGKLDKNVTWISLCIALAPMLGFMGTVIGMIEAFDKIQQVGDISAVVVASGIKVSLLTTVCGLIVAMILQLFLNYILVKIEGATNEMEDASISLLDTIVKYEEKKNLQPVAAAPAQEVVVENPTQPAGF